MVKALVIGGGIAGSVSAMALLKAGIEAEVFEAYGRSADGVGSWLTLAVNGVEALRTIDLGDVADELGFATNTMTLRTATGRKLTEFGMGEGTRSVSRAQLYTRIRREAERRGVRFHYGRRLTTATPTANGVVAQFADGTKAEGDLLIGADGLRSRVRTIIDPKAPAARYSGLLNAGGYARGVTVDAEPGAMQMVFGKRAFLGYVVNPNGEVWWFANLGRAAEPTESDLAAFTQPFWRKELHALFKDDNSPALELIAATDEIAGGWPTFDFPTVPTWRRDRMVIIGDAAHAASPASGQGASMAIEDSVTLARCLRDHPIPAAFARYEQLRRARVERVVAQGKKSGDQKAPGPVARVLRDHVILPLVFKLQRSPGDSTAWLFDHRIDWAA